VLDRPALFTRVPPGLFGPLAGGHATLYWAILSAYYHYEFEREPFFLLRGVVLDTAEELVRESAIWQERRQELDARNRDLELRENLIKDAEKRLENRIDELKDVENRINGKGGEQAAKFKSLVLMYEGMKAKDAARIFDRLDPAVLVDVTNAMNPRKLADILALMSAEMAQRLTVELARRNASGERGLPASDLPKIERRPGT